MTSEDLMDSLATTVEEALTGLKPYEVYGVLAALMMSLHAMVQEKGR